MVCAGCGSEIADGAGACGSCGKRPRGSGWRAFLSLPGQADSGPRVRWAVALLALFVLSLLAAALFGPHSHDFPESAFHEIAAAATLRRLSAAQERFRSGRFVDIDGDGAGEFGTLLELAGVVPPRSRPGGPRGGVPLPEPVLAPALGTLDGGGIVIKKGYCFLLYLPAAAPGGRFVHETGPASAPGFSGPVGADGAEGTWRAYAWPIRRGETGNRCFLVDQSGDVLQSSNEVARWEGATRPPAPDSAFLGSGITARAAAGMVGRDGDYWRVLP